MPREARAPVGDAGMAIVCRAQSFCRIYSEANPLRDAIEEAS